MKEIEFRVWNPSTKVFDDGFWIYQSGQIDHDFSTECNEIIVQRFIGLKDKKNKKIYEGDIVKYVGLDDLSYKLPGIVSVGEYFTHGKEFPHFGARIQRLDMKNQYFGLNKQDSKEYLIIGNIFENPELLNGSK